MALKFTKHPGTGYIKAVCDVCCGVFYRKDLIYVTDPYNFQKGLFVCKDDLDKRNPGVLPIKHVERPCPSPELIRPELDPIYSINENDNRAPSAPRNGKAIGDPVDDYIDIYFDAPIDTGSSGILGYIVKRTTPQTNNDYTELNTNSGTPFYIDSAANISLEYTYKVAAYNSFGTGPYSELFYWPIPDLPPTGETYLSTSQSDDIITTGTSYYIRLSHTSNGVFSSTIPLKSLTVIGNIASSDKIIGEKVVGTTGEINVSGIGTGSVVFSTSPTLTSSILTTPILGIPTSGTLTNCTGLPLSTGISGLAANVATFLATPSSANLITALTNETGTGAAMLSISGTYISPVLGTPTSGTLTNCTGLPISGISNLGAGVATFLGTSSSANLISAITDETGTGNTVFATSPTFVTPLLGIPTSGTLTSCIGLPVSSGISNLASGISTFLTTPSSSNYKAAITDETGSGSAVFATSPTLVTPTLGAAIATSIRTTNAGLLDTNGNTILALNAVGSANFITGFNAAASGKPKINSTSSSDSNVGISFISKGTGYIKIKGTGTNDSAPAGYDGEPITATASGVTMSSGVYKDITSISLTAGHWIVYGNTTYVAAAGTVDQGFEGSISLTSATIENPISRIITPFTVTTTNEFVVPIHFYKLSSTTTVYLVGYSAFTVSTLTANGYILARRIR